MKKILVVDDNPYVQELVRATFEYDPYEILTADDGEQALILAQTQMPEIILLDVGLPGKLNGLEVCRLLKHHEQTKHLFIFFLTARGHACDKQAGYEAGADDYFIKPFSPLELMRRVVTALEKKPA